MAEAHQAVSYAELIKNEHTDTNHDKEVLQLVWQSGWRSWKKRIARSKNKLRNGIYPAHIESLWVVIGVVMALHFATQKVPYDLVNILIKIMPEWVFA
jgi:carnitine O-palmitoyltransferase 1, liver isoform